LGSTIEVVDFCTARAAAYRLQMRKGLQTTNKPVKPRNIVDPVQWHQSEVSSVAEARMQSPSSAGKRGDARVSSIRSSLFKRAAQSAATGNGASNIPMNACTSGIFKCADDVKELQQPLESSSSPSLQMCDYGKRGTDAPWTKDVFALVHNGIRHEMEDLVVMLLAFQNIGDALVTVDFSELRGWWNTFSDIVEDYLDLEEKVIMPWVNAALTGQKSPDSKMALLVNESSVRRQGILDSLLQLRASFEIVCKHGAAPRTSPVPVNMVALEIFRGLDNITVKIADYFTEEETLLSAMLSLFYPNEKDERDRILASIVKHATSGEAECVEEFLALQTRWMTDQKGAKAHQKFLQSVFEFSQSKINSQFELQHAGTVAVFKVKGNIE
jgi:hypothetical protein